ncbi:putative serine/threonine-protein kinase PkwA [Planctomycetaceae bacterium]|nr:putative serine/threonine-protein kinase PkwA [Planctomycetaceae bacterium]
MRTLGLSLLALLATTFAFLSNGGPVAAEPTDKEKSEMAAKVYALLKDKCASCHSADAKVVFGKKGTLNYILDYDKLISEKLIDTKSPEKSELYTELSEGNMPRELDKDGKPKTKKKLAQADIDLVLNWIKAGAPRWPLSASSAIALEGHEEKVTAVTFSPDGKHVLTGSWDKTARLWNAATGKEIRKLEQPEPMLGVAFSSDGKTLFTLAMNRMVTIWDSSSGKEIRNFQARCAMHSSLAISPDGKTLLTTDYDTVRLWDIETGKEVRTFGGQVADEGNLSEEIFYSAVFSINGKQILASCEDKTARLWETDSGKLVRKFEGHTETVLCAVFSPDGKLVLTGSDDKTAKLWDAATGKEIRRLEGHTGRLRSVALSPDGKYAVTTGDHTGRVWDVATGKELNCFKHSFEGEMKVTAEPLCAAFSPDGKRVVSCDVAGFVRIWPALPEKK